jgi:hypothetical protein
MEIVLRNKDLLLVIFSFQKGKKVADISGTRWIKNKWFGLYQHLKKRENFDKLGTFVLSIYYSADSIIWDSLKDESLIPLLQIDEIGLMHRIFQNKEGVGKYIADVALQKRNEKLGIYLLKHNFKISNIEEIAFNNSSTIFLQIVIDYPKYYKFSDRIPIACAKTGKLEILKWIYRGNSRPVFLSKIALENHHYDIFAWVNSLSEIRDNNEAIQHILHLPESENKELWLETIFTNSLLKAQFEITDLLLQKTKYNFSDPRFLNHRTSLVMQSDNIEVLKYAFEKNLLGANPRYEARQDKTEVIEFLSEKKIPMHVNHMVKQAFETNDEDLMLWIFERAEVPAINWQQQAIRQGFLEILSRYGSSDELISIQNTLMTSIEYGRLHIIKWVLQQYPDITPGGLKIPLKNPKFWNWLWERSSFHINPHFWQMHLHELCSIGNYNGALWHFEKYLTQNKLGPISLLGEDAKIKMFFSWMKMVKVEREIQYPYQFLQIVFLTLGMKIGVFDDKILRILILNFVIFIDRLELVLKKTLSYFEFLKYKTKKLALEPQRKKYQSASIVLF